MATKQVSSFTPGPINMVLAGTGMIEPKKIDRKFVVQRPIEPARLKIIKKSMNVIGYDMSKPVVLSQSNVAVDGNHRIELALKLGINKIPFVQYNFATPQDEYRYFQLAQLKTAGMKARDELFAYYQTKHPYATLIYKLANDKMSQFSGCHDLKMKADDKSLISNMKVENLCYIINGIIFKRKTGWSRTNADYLANLSVSLLSSQKEFLKAIYDVNDFLVFFWNSFGWVTDKKGLMYREHFLLATIDLYNEFLLPNPIFDTDKKKVESKLSKIKVDKELVTNHKQTIRSILLKQVNHKRTRKDRIYS
jgi:hypothetical protein